jgi:uncharacterized membrane protein
MQSLGIHYFPFTLPFLLLLLAVLVALSMLAVLRVLQFAYGRLGISPRYFFFWLFLSLAGSSINIPIARLATGHIVSDRVVMFFGIPHVVPLAEHWPGTILAVNVGGAVIPVLLSLYLMAKNRLFGRALWGTAIVAAACYWLATPVPGVGIAIPIFYPPLITAVVALLLSRAYAAPLAYICGSLGTLIGADILNLGKLQGMGAPVASIGGAGTFDGIFVTGLLAVLLAGILSTRKLAPST